MTGTTDTTNNENKPNQELPENPANENEDQEQDFIDDGSDPEDLEIFGDSDGDDSDEDGADDDEDDFIEDEEDQGDDEKGGDKSDSENNAEPGKPEGALPSASGKTDEGSDSISLEDEIKTRISPSYKPGSKDFFAATLADAKAEVEKEMGEFDGFDPEHITRLSYYAAKAANDREAEYNGAIEIIKSERTGRVEKQAALDRQQKIESDIDSILTTTELKNEFGKVLKSMSENSRGDYLVLLEDLDQGKPERLVSLAKKIAGPHSKLLDKKPQKKAGPAPDRKGRTVMGSDVLGF